MATAHTFMIARQRGGRVARAMGAVDGGSQATVVLLVLRASSLRSGCWCYNWCMQVVVELLGLLRVGRARSYDATATEALSHSEACAELTANSACRACRGAETVYRSGASGK